jgi:hypothetical protein
MLFSFFCFLVKDSDRTIPLRPVHKPVYVRVLYTVASKELFSRFLCPLDNPEGVRINTHLCIRIYLYLTTEIALNMSQNTQETPAYYKVYASREYKRGGAVG